MDFHGKFLKMVGNLGNLGSGVAPWTIPARICWEFGEIFGNSGSGAVPGAIPIRIFLGIIGNFSEFGVRGGSWENSHQKVLGILGDSWGIRALELLLGEFPWEIPEKTVGK